MKINSPLKNIKKGFTLVELLVVLAIIGLLAGAGIPGILNAQKSSRDTARMKQLEAISGAISEYDTKNPGTATISVYKTEGEGVLIGTSSDDERGITVSPTQGYTFLQTDNTCSTKSTKKIVAYYITTSEVVLCTEKGNKDIIEITTDRLNGGEGNTKQI